MKTNPAYFFVLACLILSNCLQSDKYTNSFTLKGEIIGQDSGNIVLDILIKPGTHINDTANIVDG